MWFWIAIAYIIAIFLLMKLFQMVHQRDEEIKLMESIIKVPGKKLLKK